MKLHTCTLFSHTDRSTSISSLLNRTVSFSQLNTQDRESNDAEGEEGREREEISPHPSSSPTVSALDNASLSKALSNLSKSLTSINTAVSASPHSKLLEEDSQLSMSSSHLYQPTDDDDSVSLTERQLQRKKKERGADDSKMETAKGGYLGRFTNDRRGKRKVCTQIIIIKITIHKSIVYKKKMSHGLILWAGLHVDATCVVLMAERDLKSRL